MNHNKTLTKSRTNRQIWGVAGGLGEYFNVDPTLVRIFFVLLSLAGGPGLLLYIVLAIVMPQHEDAARTIQYEKHKNEEYL